MSGTGGFAYDERRIVAPDRSQHGPSIAWFKDPAANIMSVLQTS